MLEERKQLRPDPRWTAFLADLHATDEKPLRPAGHAAARAAAPTGFDAWRAHQRARRSASRATPSPPSRCRSAT